MELFGNESEARAMELLCSAYNESDINKVCSAAFFVVVPFFEIPYCDVFAFKNSDIMFACKGTIGRNGVSRSRREGDGTTPAGIFTFGSCFGLKQAPKGMMLPYKLIDENDYWNSDFETEPFNKMVNSEAMPVGWDSSGSEHLCEYKGVYNYCASINYNTDPGIKGLGSAIFFHCVNETFTGTAGCVAIPENYMIRALQLMERDSRIIIDG